MCCVRLPCRLYANGEGGGVSDEDAEKVRCQIYNKHNIEVPFIVVQGHLYVRISVHIYNEVEEYTILANAVDNLPDNFLSSY